VAPARLVRMDRADYLAAWSRLHEGIDPYRSRVIRAWLAVVYRVAWPPARAGVAPTLITAAGPLLAGGAVAAAAVGLRLALAAAALGLLAGLADAVDGAVAVLSGRTSAAGFVLDSVADRVTDALLLVALVLLGAPGWLGAAAGAALGLLEYTRARAAAAPTGPPVATVTIGERPTRVVLAVLGLLVAGVVPGRAAAAVTAAAGASALVAGVGVGQLLAALLRGPTGPTSRATVRAPSSTNGTPPPGWAEPPTR
jgi:phosphatidylglycerophosphate synthase